MNYPEYSVIIPSHNRADYIEECLKSVFKQSFKDFEVILVDDGSGDNTSKIVEKFDSSHFKYLYQDNRGPASARNKGICKAQGNYIAFLDSDDKWTENKLEIVNRHIEANPRYKVFHTQERWFKKGRIHNPKKKHKKPHGDIFRNALKLCSVSISTAVVKREVFDRVGLFDESLPVCEDYDFWVRVSLKYPVYLIDEVLTIKDGGRKDQLSSIYMGKDKYRIKSLTNLIRSNNLNDKKFEEVINQLQKKCSIYAGGCLKRGRREEAEYYFSLPEVLKNERNQRFGR